MSASLSLTSLGWISLHPLLVLLPLVDLLPLGDLLLLLTFLLSTSSMFVCLCVTWV